MSRKIKYWCDNGAFHGSADIGYIDAEEMGYTDKEWDEATEEEKEESIKPIALDKLDWGFCDVEEED